MECLIPPTRIVTRQSVPRPRASKPSELLTISHPTILQSPACLMKCHIPLTFFTACPVDYHIPLTFITCVPCGVSHSSNSRRNASECASRSASPRAPPPPPLLLLPPPPAVYRLKSLDSSRKGSSCKARGCSRDFRKSDLTFHNTKCRMANRGKENSTMQRHAPCSRLVLQKKCG